MSTNLLLLDKSLLVQRVVELAFRDKGVDVHTAESADEALSIAENLRPNVIVASVDAQSSDGMDFCRRLRQNPILSQTPLLLLTNAHQGIEDAEIKEAGATGAVEKPIKPQTFTIEVERVIASGSVPEPEERADSDFQKRAISEETADEESLIPEDVIEELAVPLPSDEGSAYQKAGEPLTPLEGEKAGSEEEKPPPSVAIQIGHGEKLDAALQKCLERTAEKFVPTLLRRLEATVEEQLPDLIEQIIIREIEKIKRGE